MPCGREGNRRSGVGLNMRYRLQWFIHLQDHGLRKQDEQPADIPPLRTLDLTLKR